MSGVVEVHQAQQALHERGRRTTVTAEPIAAKTAGQQETDQSVGHGGQAGCQRRAEGGRNAGVVGDLFGVPVDGRGGGSVLHRG